MRRKQGFRRAVVALLLVALVAVGVATVGSARPADVVTAGAKLGPKPMRGGEDALYRTSFTSNQGTMNKVSSRTEFPAGSVVQATSPGAPTCVTPSASVVTCSLGNVAGGQTVALSVQVVLPGVAPAGAVVPAKCVRPDNSTVCYAANVPTVWQFKDAGGGQPPGAESSDAITVSDSTDVYAAGETSVHGSCLSKLGGESLTASLGDAAISFTTPAFGSLLCVPLGLQVSPKPPAPVQCFPGRQCTSETLTSFAGATFLSNAPAQGTLVWPSSSVADKKAPVVFNDGAVPPRVLLVPLCSNVTLSAEFPACEVAPRKFSGGLVSVTVRWLGNDPAWDM